MVKEYAIDPELAGNFQTLNLISVLFDYRNPRRISRFPKKWERMVCEVAGEISDLNKSRVVEKLKQLKANKNCLLSFARDYNPVVSWMENIQTTSTQKPFVAVLTEDAGENYISSDQLDESHPLLTCQTDFIVSRNDDNALINVLETCLQQASEIIFIDPHINFYHAPRAQRYKQTFNKLISVMLNRTNGTPFKVIFCLTGRDFAEKSADDIAADIQSFFRLTPQQISIVLLPTDIAHNRYILTDVASFSLGDSIWYDANQTREDHMAMMSYESYVHHKKKYLPQ